VLGFETALLGSRARDAGAVASLTPAQVANVVAGVVDAKRPRLRYRVGAQANMLLTLRGLLPERVFESIVFSQFVRPLLPAQGKGAS
jgi:hypothetical protein